MYEVNKECFYTLKNHSDKKLRMSNFFYLSFLLNDKGVTTLHRLNLNFQYQ